MSVRVVIHGRTVGSLHDFYREVESQLSLPDYFGRNLDALWDVLSTDIEGPFELIWEDADISRKSMGRDFERVMAFGKELERERGDFRLIVKGVKIEGL